jgi:hypothetical protein
MATLRRDRHHRRGQRSKANSITLHTSPGCYITMSGEGYYPHISRPDCSAVGDGCGMETRAGQNFGDEFSNINGGVYAMEWTSGGISAWLFSGHGIPEGIMSGSPNPAAWGVPLARFAGGNGSNIDSYFRDNNIVFDTTFCGGWTGNPSVWDSNAMCSVCIRAPMCVICGS